MKFRLALLAFVFLLLPCAVMAQSTATISGTVIDPTGAVVPKARVVIKSLATGLERVLTSDDAGLYAAPSLQPGDYTISTEAAGFAPAKVDKVTLDVDERRKIDLRLQVSGTGTTIDVISNSGAAQVEATTITVGQVIDAITVQELPLNGRHFLDLTVLTPGGVVAPTAGSLTGTSRGLGANSFITAGNREDSVNFQINGINLNDMSQNQITFQPSINTTSEFKLNNSTFSAEYGNNSGSVVNVLTRSGTNKFHGEVFDYFRNEALDARNYFNRSFSPATGLPLALNAGNKAPLKRNNFGAAVGGPIFKDHTFFFASYEGLRQHQGILQNSTVLSTAQRAAVVAAGKPTANALLAVIPVANSGNNYVAFTPGPVKIDQFTGDVLHVFSEKDQLHGFYAFQSDVRTEPNLQGNTIPGFGDHRQAHRQVATLNEVHTFNSKLVTESRIGANRINITFLPNTLIDPSTFGIGDGLTGPVGLPQITLSDIGLNFGGPSGFPQGRADTKGVISNTTTYLLGRHTIKGGGEFRRYLGASFTGDTGTLTYASTAVNFTNDTATGFSIQPTTVSSRVYINAANGFLQDNFKLSPRLTLEYGFRFEWNGTPTEGENRFVIFNPGTDSLVRVGTFGLNKVYKQNYNYEPRLGFVFDAFGNETTVLRGGYGYLADQPVQSNVSGLTTNPPFSTSVAYSGTAIPVSTVYNSAKASGIAVSNVNPNFKNAYTQTFNVNLQQVLPTKTVFSIGYFGSVGTHLRIRTNENQVIGGVQTNRPFTALALNSPIDPGANLSTTSIAEANSIGYSRYNAMWVVLTKNAGHGLSFNMNYQWSKSLDINSLGSQGGYTLQDSLVPQENYGLSDFDTRHHYAGNAIYILPFKRNRFVSGYQLSTIIQYQTGNPVNILASNSTYTLAGLVRPNLVGTVVKAKTQLAGVTNVTYIPSTGLGAGGTVCDVTNYTPACVYEVNGTQASAAATTAPTAYTGVGNIARNAGFGPGFADVDLSLEKETKLFEGLNFKLRVDSFDLFNHPNFGQPSGNVQSSTFGQISATRFAISDGGSSRQLQVSGKFLF